MGKIEVTVTLLAYICNKAHAYAISRGAEVGCPYCLREKLLETEEWLGDSEDREREQVRRISALKGTITRMKKRQ